MEADVVGIVHDVASFYTCEKLDYKIVEVLEKMPKNKQAFLILNKVRSGIMIILLFCSKNLLFITLKFSGRSCEGKTKTTRQD